MIFKYFFIIIIFFLLVLLQNSFLQYFIFLGNIPEFVFILFFILVFTQNKERPYFIFFISFVAGFFLDIFSKNIFGVNILSLLIINFFIFKILQILREPKERHSFNYFIFLFIISFIINKIISSLFFYFSEGLMLLNWYLLLEVFYNLIFSIFLFLIYKFLCLKKGNIV